MGQTIEREPGSEDFIQSIATKEGEQHGAAPLLLVSEPKNESF